MGFSLTKFAKGLSPVLSVLSIATQLTKSKKDDRAVALSQKLAVEFLGDASKDQPLRGAASVLVKEMLLNPEFLKRSKLTEAQAGTTLIAALTYLQPDAVDTEEEITALLIQTAEAYNNSLARG